MINLMCQKIFSRGKNSCSWGDFLLNKAVFGSYSLWLAKNFVRSIQRYIFQMKISIASKRILLGTKKIVHYEFLWSFYRQAINNAALWFVTDPSRLVMDDVGVFKDEDEERYKHLFMATLAYRTHWQQKLVDVKLIPFDGTGIYV